MKSPRWVKTLLLGSWCALALAGCVRHGCVRNSDCSSKDECVDGRCALRASGDASVTSGEGGGSGGSAGGDGSSGRSGAAGSGSGAGAGASNSTKTAASSDASGPLDGGPEQ